MEGVQAQRQMTNVRKLIQTGATVIADYDLSNAAVTTAKT
jgi:hypothetical protein